MLFLLIISPLIGAGKILGLPEFSEGSYDYRDSVEQLDNDFQEFIRDMQITNGRVKRQAGYDYERPSVSFDLPSQQPATSKPVTQLSDVVPTLQQQQYYAYPMPQQPSVLISGSPQTGFTSVSSSGTSINTSPSTQGTFKPSTNAPVYLPPSVSSQRLPGLDSGPVFSSSTSRPIQPQNPSSIPSVNYLPPSSRSPSSPPTTGLAYEPPTTRFTYGSSTTASNYGYSSTSSTTASAAPSLYVPPSTLGVTISSQGPTSSISTPAPTYLPPFKK